MLDSKLKRRKPTKRPHRKVVRTAVVDGKLRFEIRQRKERMTGIKAFLVFSVTALDFAIMSGRVRTNQFMANSKLLSRFFEQSRDIAFAVGKAIGKFKAIICLNAFNMNALASIPLHKPLKKICRRKCRLLRISSQKAKSSKLVYGGVLV